MMNEDTVKNLALDAARQQGHGDCTVTLSEGMTLYTDEEGTMKVPRWTIRVTRKDGKFTRFLFDMLPEYSEDRIKAVMSEHLVKAVWE